MIFTWPHFMFDRSRHVMMAVILPASMAYLLFYPGRQVRKLAVIAGLIFALNIWFLLVMQYRSSKQMESFMDTSTLSEGKVKHQGLDMLEELCYINQFIDQGTYKISYGERYFGEFVNFIPRALWPGKPLVGIDYAIARGQGGGDSETGVYATISTGMIGQGVVNFGALLGPVAAALLMSLWAGVLAWLWTQRERLPRVILFMLGMALTFNMGRDITLLVLWPFVFSYALVLWYERKQPGQSVSVRTRPRMPDFRRSTPASPPANPSVLPKDV
jgi:hypothetical protein